MPDTPRQPARQMVGRARPTAGGLVADLTDLWELVVSYAKQETVEPLKGLGRFLGWGAGGAILTTLGLVLLDLALLRALQTETNLTRHLSWVPYLIAIAAAGVVVALAVRAITKPQREKKR